MSLKLLGQHDLLSEAPRLLAGGAVLYVIGLVIYRLLFHPLRNIPGPWYAAATYWYEFYQDVILDGHYIKDYPKLHAKYGPVVRVSPSRVHVNDPEYFKEVYGLGTKYTKDPDFFQSGGGIKYSIIMLIDPEAHKQRRSTVKSLFSPKQMDQLAPVVLDVVKRGMARAQRSFERGEPLSMQPLWQSVTVDTIMPVLFDRHMNLVDSDEEIPPFLDIMHKFAENFLITKHFPFLIHLAMSIPMSIAQKVLPGYAQFRQQCAEWIQEIEDKQINGNDTAADGRSTYFDLLLSTRNTKMYHKLSRDALVDEALALCFAGTDTTSFALTFGTYYLLRNEDKLAKMLEELKNVPTNAEGLYEYRDVCKLPYLVRGSKSDYCPQTAVIKEILRLSSPVPGIIPRRVPAGGATVAGHYLPEGTTVSQALRSIHDNASLFPEPEKFIPERWLGEDGWALEKYFVPFSKGPRSCLGMNVAYVEMYLSIANFFSRFNMSLYKTDETTAIWIDSAAARIWKPIRVKINSVNGETS
ncbi:elymoclavine monooxygenase [Colletotrichum truncatum]|uniref:Elymoclavine monooxygenase n=1 Tax=Colletotrichum truncatum TaxID=5467 RepID=A0ACC3Z8R9_COLTU|nr:elymoclavine monooxygenase [Colletotrichum truncatum]KAF6780962.1 elymoclavine monooxygenase [Colletotrichum truncatum]